MEKQLNLKLINWLPILLLGATLILVIYKPIINSYFLGEDYAWWPYVREKRLLQVLTFFIKPPSRSLAGFYHPLVGLVYWFNVNFFWFKSWAFHLTNLIIHFGVFILVLNISQQLLQDKQQTYLAGLLFLVFPFHSEAVAWIDGRHDLLVSFFYLLSFYFFIKKQKVWPSVLFFILALTCKETAFTLPLAEVVYLLMRKKKDISAAIKQTIPFWLVLAGYYFLHGAYVGQLNPLAAASHLGIIVARPLFFYLIFLALCLIGYFIFSKQRQIKLVFFLALLIGIFYLPAGFTPTQERYLYLASSVTAIFSSQVFFMLFYAFKNKLIKLLMIIIMGAILIKQSLYLSRRINDWRKAAIVAQSTVENFKTLAKDIPSSATLYFFNLPDNYHGSYIFRTHVKEALEYGAQKSYPKMIVLPPTLGVGKTEVKFLDQNNINLTSDTGYLIFSPGISHYTNDKPVIETTDYILTMKDKSHLTLSLKNDYLGKNNVSFFSFDYGLIKLD